MRTVLDATPLLGPRTGVGRYVHELVQHLPAAAVRLGLDCEVRVTTWTARGGRVTGLPPGVNQVGPRVPARLVRAAWLRGDRPRIESLVGRCDVFHGTNFVSPPTRGAREVVMVHDLTYALLQDTVSAASLAYRELVPRALARGATVVTPSETVAEQVREHYGLAAERVVATRLGVGDAWFTAEPADPAWLRARGLPTDYLVFVGSLDPRKNLPRLLEAYRRLRAELPGCPALVLAGPAGREEALLGAEGVSLTGWLEEDELRAVVAASRGLVLPSVDEGFGLPVLEALATGRPVVRSTIPALEEVSGGLAVAAAPDDADALAGALLEVLRAPADADAVPQRRAWARRWTWDACAEATLGVYTRG
ncbi:glycosyltransferase family 1 protein [Cellulomonas cellasea]|uniref:Glycosyltransferase involved in cell wall biosynthesis n=1 Tax=Cellulomonas cellasea TaxID=43670 RepID=A0A7W4UEW7_9CELL|nr:glycosyltransferase family 1 protein [Cellulomonas cellasea]MBB2922881.1 glycosyltransferase involved in cell wall biosynthesis [Cellulomonas cellasea]